MQIVGRVDLGCSAADHGWFPTGDRLRPRSHIERRRQLPRFSPGGADPIESLATIPPAISESAAPHREPVRPYPEVRTMTSESPAASNKTSNQTSNDSSRPEPDIGNMITQYRRRQLSLFREREPEFELTEPLQEQ